MRGLRCTTRVEWPYRNRSRLSHLSLRCRRIIVFAYEARLAKGITRAKLAVHNRATRRRSLFAWHCRQQLSLLHLAHMRILRCSAAHRRSAIWSSVFSIFGTRRLIPRSLYCWSSSLAIGSWCAGFPCLARACRPRTFRSSIRTRTSLPGLTASLMPNHLYEDYTTTTCATLKDS